MPEPRAVPPEPPRPSPDAAVGGTSGLRRAILMRLRHDGPSSPERLAEQLGVSRTGVLQQLHALEAAGLVNRQAVRHGVGRPRHVYDVTDAAQDLFPTNYDGLASGLLEAIHAIGGDALIDGVFEARRRSTSERLRERIGERVGPDASIVERARELAVIQDEQGYFAEAVVGTDGSVRLVERNCAIHRVVAGHAVACESELELFREVLGVEVERETHIASGDRCCSYRIGAAPGAAQRARA